MPYIVTHFITFTDKNRRKKNQDLKFGFWNLSWVRHNGVGLI